MDRSCATCAPEFDEAFETADTYLAEVARRRNEGT